MAFPPGLAAYLPPGGSVEEREGDLVDLFGFHVDQQHAVDVEHQRILEELAPRLGAGGARSPAGLDLGDPVAAVVRGHEEVGATGGLDLLAVDREREPPRLLASGHPVAATGQVRLGESTPRTVDVKLVAATNADLAKKVAEGTFRADLHARLNPAARLVVPPLRDRADDIPKLLGDLLRRRFAAGSDRALLASYMEAASISGVPLAEVHLGRAPKSARGVAFVLGRESVRDLERHPFPGNVRELELFVTSAVVFALTDALEAAEQGRTASGDAARIVPVPARLVRELLHDAREPTDAPSHAADARTLTLRAADGLHEVARGLEVQLYEQLYAESNGDFARMASSLLGRDDAASARKVRLRFNQLGLRVRRRSKS